MEIRNKSFAND